MDWSPQKPERRARERDEEQIRGWIKNGFLPKSDPYYASALLLAATIRSKDVAPRKFLGDDEELVRRTAATCLLIRPLGSVDRKLIADRFHSIKKDRKVRPLLYHALARIPPNERTRADLLRCAASDLGHQRAVELQTVLAGFGQVGVESQALVE